MLELFITGVDESFDKIFVTAGIAATMQSLGYSTAVYKPVETGATIQNGYLKSPDLSYIKFIDPYIKTYFSYLFKENTSPLLAAAAEKTEIDKNSILSDFQKIQDKNEFLFVDAGFGLATPLGKNFLLEDMIKLLDIPLLITFSANPATINNTILSINRAKQTGIPVRGSVIGNFPTDASTEVQLIPKIIEEYTDTKVLGILPYFDKITLNPNDLITEILKGCDIEGILNLKIAKLQL